MKIEVWSDIACPWCFLGKHRIEAAVKQFGGEHEIVYRAFELDPRTPRVFEDGLSHADRIAAKLRMPRAKLDAMHDKMRAMGEADGIDFQFDRVKGGNSFDAHRLIRLARERGIQAQVKERMMAAYFTDGEPIGDRDALTRIAVAAGLDAADVADVLGSDRFTAEVRADEQEANELGITGVPCFVIDRKLAVPGAQSIEVLVQALGEAA